VKLLATAVQLELLRNGSPHTHPHVVPIQIYILYNASTILSK